jgi:hypothetical protein
MSCDQLKERYKAQILYYVNTGRLTCIQCGLDTLLNLPFNSIFELCLTQTGLVPRLCSGDFRVLYPTFNSRFRVCAH